MLPYFWLRHFLLALGAPDLCWLVVVLVGFFFFHVSAVSDSNLPILLLLDTTKYVYIYYSNHFCSLGRTPLFSCSRFYTKKMNYSASSIVAKWMFSLHLLSKSTPTSIPATYIRFSEIRRTLKPSSLSFSATFFLASSNSSTFSSTVK